MITEARPAVTRSELVEDLARAADLSRDLSETAVTRVIEGITEALAKGERVEFRGFGTFSIHYRFSRVSRNPKTGQ